MLLSKSKLHTLILALIMTPTLSFAQGNNGNGNGNGNNNNAVPWRMNGNTANANNFLGTTNNTDLVLMSNQHEGLRINPAGESIFSGRLQLTHYTPTQNANMGWLTVDSQGILTSLTTRGARELMVEAIYEPVFCFTDVFGNYPAPIWSSEQDLTGNPGILYTGEFCDARVGINTKNVPLGYSLGVDGKIICEEVKVKLSQNWPDYVFGEDYELAPLSEVASFIDENHHLPGVPSAAEVEQNGITLGEMDAAILEKVEQLYLYTIELEEKVKALEAQLNDAKNK